MAAAKSSRQARFRPMTAAIRSLVTPGDGREPNAGTRYPFGRAARQDSEPVPSHARAAFACRRNHPRARRVTSAFPELRLLIARPRRAINNGPEQVQQKSVATSGYSITSSAATRRLCGTMRPNAFAVFRLSVRLNLVGNWIGSSPAFSPLRMRSTYPAARWNVSAKSEP